MEWINAYYQFKLLTIFVVGGVGIIAFGIAMFHEWWNEPHRKDW